MVILGRVRNGPDGGGGRGAAHDRPRPGAVNGVHARAMLAGAAGRAGQSGAARHGAWPGPAVPTGVGALARTPERADVRSSTRGGPDGRPE